MQSTSTLRLRDITQRPLDDTIELHQMRSSALSALAKSELLENDPIAYFRDGSLTVIVSDGNLEGFSIELYEHDVFVEHASVCLFNNLGWLDDAYLVSDDTIGLTFAGLTWHCTVTEKPRFILKFPNLFSAGIGLLKFHSRNLTRLKVRRV